MLAIFANQVPVPSADLASLAISVSIGDVNSGTQITAAVPAGANTGKIAVKTKGGSANSKAKFTVTP